ncbi:hypothetical protein F511_41673 [Dorcoceras hygrometricum]|uniref:Dystroglycan-like n=1 Tax=Dorcoceras hygrometricum TaxID=472368 RepID=A0A2Z7BFZ8_9LAMI|nr:hypothetical protein F511_41673 [Dorcoceras hygrometricum]
MASSFITNAHQVDYESVLAIPDNEGMLNMFKALEASGLRGFLGCQSVLYEKELEQFFDTALVQDWDITGAVSGKFFSISQSRFAEVFDLPTEGLVDFSEVSKNLVYDARSIFSKSGVPVSTHGKKRFMKYEYRLLNDILAKEITVKACSFDAVTNERFLMMTAIQFGLKDVVPLQIVEPIPAATAEKSPLPKRKSKKMRLVLSKDSDDENVEEQESVKDTVAVAVEESTVVKHTDEVDVIIGQVLEETSKLATDEAEQREQQFDEPEVGEIEFGYSPVKNADNFEQWLDESFEAFIETETVDKTEDNKEVAVSKTPEKAVGSNQTDEEIMSIDNLLMQISDNMMLPSLTAAEVTKIRLGSSIEINEVRDSDWYYASLPRISTHDKGKEPLEEDEPVKWNPAREMVELICGDVEFLVQLRDRVMKDVVDFFHSFSLNKLSDLESLRDLKEKENLMLNWVEASSLETAVRRRVYILAKYREILPRNF